MDLPLIASAISKLIHIPTWRIRKEELAHERQQKEQILSGLIGGWSCLERGSSYRAVYNAEAGFPQLKHYQVQCKHLYFYFDDSEYGFTCDLQVIALRAGC